MKISIVTPSYNQGQFIEQAIQSVQNQNYPNFEHIIIDNQSQDKTKEVIKKYPNLIFISEPDKGQSDALNKGFKRATGDIIGWLNADDKYLPECFKVVVNYFQEKPELDMLYGNYNWINEDNKLIKKRKELDFDLFMLKYLHTLYIPSTASFLRRKIFLDHHFLDISLNYAMDYDFFLRLALHGYKIKHINYFLADYRWHQDSKSTQGVIKAAKERENSLLKHDHYLQALPLFQRVVARKILMYLARSKRYFLKTIKGYYFS